MPKPKKKSKINTQTRYQLVQALQDLQHSRQVEEDYYGPRKPVTDQYMGPFETEQMGTISTFVGPPTVDQSLTDELQNPVFDKDAPYPPPFDDSVRLQWLQEESTRQEKERQYQRWLARQRKRK